MNRTTQRLTSTAAALVLGMVAATAQTVDPHHAGAAQPTMPQPGMPMAMPTSGTPASGPMGAGMPNMPGMAAMMDRMSQMMGGGMGMKFEHVEGRIAFLKAELKITDAQAAPWSAYADTMRADAAAMKTMHDAMQTAAMPRTAPDRMAAMRKMMSARMAMMDHAEASMKTLYAALSTEQQTTFDALISGPMGMM